MTSIRLPDGCTGLDMADGTKYTAERPGGRVDISGRHSRYIGTSWYGQSGVMRTGPQFSFGTRGGRRCQPCNRLWNAWSARCPNCGADTVKEQ